MDGGTFTNGGVFRIDEGEECLVAVGFIADMDGLPFIGIGGVFQTDDDREGLAISVFGFRMDVDGECFVTCGFTVDPFIEGDFVADTDRESFETGDFIMVVDEDIFVTGGPMKDMD